MGEGGSGAVRRLSQEVCRAGGGCGADGRVEGRCGAGHALPLPETAAACSMRRGLRQRTAGGGSRLLCVALRAA